MPDNQTYDYIIVGAGSAGCVLANRLSEDAGSTVLLIEFGGTDAGPFINMPAALSYPLSMRQYDWGYASEPEPHLGGRRISCPRGKVIGGSSSINGMVYVRGHPQDFNSWVEHGAQGWGASDVLPYFKRLESACGRDPAYRGQEGPLHVIHGELRNPLYQAFIKAGQQAGYPNTEDYNAVQQEGFGPMEQTIWQGRRWSAASAYLKPALKRTNLTLATRTIVHKIDFTGNRATGVLVQTGNKTRHIQASKEVILAASSINSPKILLLSGIGDGDELKSLGIPVNVHRPGVGKNLQDHLEIYLQVACKEPITLNRHIGLLSKGLIGLQWLLFNNGIGASNHFEAAGFIRSEAGVPYPDIQYHFLPAAIRYDGTSAVKGDGFQVHVGPMRSPSRGSVTLKSANPDEAPAIRFNYMSHEKDWHDFRTAIRLTRELFLQPAFEPFADGEITPGPKAQSDQDLDAFVRDEVESAYHPCGTCKMGDPNDEMTVVDPTCKVVGIEGLRVVDSSVFPQITNGNLNAPTLMLAEKASDHILGRSPLSPEPWDGWIHPNWQTQQR